MSIVRYLLFGIGIRAIPFAIGMAIFPVVDRPRPCSTR